MHSFERSILFYVRLRTPPLSLDLMLYFVLVAQIVSTFEPLLVFAFTYNSRRRISWLPLL